MARRSNNEEVSQNNHTLDAVESQGDSGARVETRPSGPYAQMLEIASRLPSAYRAGAALSAPFLTARTAFDGTIDTRAMQRGETKEYTPAGIMRYGWVPTLGVSKDGVATAPVNMAIKEQYAFVRKHVSGNYKNYESSDFGIYELALDSIYSAFFALVRAYGVINAFDPLNAYTPEALAAAMGFEYSTLVANQANLAFYINNFAAKLREFGMPATMRLFADHILYNSKVFYDGDSRKAQMYVMTQEAFWSYEYVDQVKGLKAVKPVTNIRGLWEVDAYQAMLDGLLTSFMNSTDVAIISGDIMKAYGDAAILQVPTMPYDYTVEFTKDYSVLLSIMNADITALNISSLRVRDAGNGNLSCQPKYTPDGGYGYVTREVPLASNMDKSDNLYAMKRALGTRVGNLGYLNFISEVPTPDEVVAASRFKVWISDVLETDPGAYPDEVKNAFINKYGFMPMMYQYSVESCGTEVIIAATMFVTAPSGTVTYALGGQETDGMAQIEGPGFGFIGYDVSGVLWTSMTVTDRNETIAGSDFKVSPTDIFIKLPYLSVFDWHHPVIIASGAAWKKDSEFDYVRRSVPPIQDLQNAVPVTKENIDQIHTARLYSLFFS